MTPADARLSVDGQAAELRGGVLALSAGPHRLLAQRAGYLDGELRIDVRGGEHEELELQLRPSAIAAMGVPAAAADTRPAARIAASPQAARRDAAADEGGSVFASPWFWTAAAVVIAGGVATALVLTADAADPEPVKPTTGVLITVLTEGR